MAYDPLTNGSRLPRTNNKVSGHEVASTHGTTTQQGSPHRSLGNKKQQANNLFDLALFFRGIAHVRLALSTYEFIMETKC